MPFTQTFSTTMSRNYDKFLGPSLYEPFAEDIGGRLHFSLPQNVLEVACGTGRATRHILHAIPSIGSVIATDVSPEMLGVAGGNIEDVRLKWQLADVHELPFDNSTFDHVVCQFGIMYFEDRKKALSEIARVLQPGGKLIFNTWDELQKNTGANLINDILQETFGKNAPDFLETGPFSFNDPKEISHLLERAGYSDIKISPVAKTHMSIDEKVFTKGFMEGTILSEFFADNDPVVREKVREKIMDAISPTSGVQGFHLQALVVEAVKP